jgi:hypothetical protein
MSIDVPNGIADVLGSKDSGQGCELEFRDAAFRFGTAGNGKRAAPTRDLAPLLVRVVLF